MAAKKPQTEREAVDGFLREINVEAAGPDSFVASGGAENDDGRVFGGITLAQALTSAGRTAPEFTVHSMHAYFLRAGRGAEPIHYRVERIREGRTFAGRRVSATQGDSLIFEAMLGFVKREEGIEHQLAAPQIAVPVEATVAELHERKHARWGGASPFDVVEVKDSPGLMAGGAPHQVQWWRPAAPLPDDALIHAAAMASMSDNTLYETVFAHHGLPPGVSLDHAIWFHRPPKWDGWLLRVCDSPVAHSARALMVASMFDIEGALVATVTQEGLFRRSW
jgi:acyl-CoA thioesterase-2